MIVPKIIGWIIIILTFSYLIAKSIGPNTTVAGLIGTVGIIVFGIGSSLSEEYLKQKYAMKVLKNEYSLKINKTVVDDKVIKCDTVIIFKQKDESNTKK